MVFAQSNEPAYTRVPVRDADKIRRVARTTNAETMDREGLSDLVDLAVDGLDSASLNVPHPQTNLIGGRTYASPSSMPSGSFSVASESLREIIGEGTAMHRIEEAKLLPLLTVVQTERDAAELETTGQSEWYIVDGGWWRAWCAFVKGGPRPGPIRNAALLADGGHALWTGLAAGENYVGMTAQSFGLLSELYGADLCLVLRGSFKDAQREQLDVKLFVKR